MSPLFAMAPGPSSRSARHSRAQLIVETPTIDVPLDIRSSNYEEWMKMAMDNVSPLASTHFCLLMFTGLRKSIKQIHGTSR